MSEMKIFHHFICISFWFYWHIFTLAQLFINFWSCFLEIILLFIAIIFLTSFLFVILYIWLYGMDSHCFITWKWLTMHSSKFLQFLFDENPFLSQFSSVSLFLIHGLYCSYQSIRSLWFYWSWCKGSQVHIR